MDKNTLKYITVGEYLASLPDLQRQKLEKIRQAVKKIVPEAEELISYNMPAFKFHGILLYFAAHKNHIGVYPGSTRSIEAFSDELTDYNTSKGTIQVRNDQKLPIRLIKRVIKFRVSENIEKEKIRKMKRRP